MHRVRRAIMSRQPRCVSVCRRRYRPSHSRAARPFHDV